jgi:hypothetical protein
MPRFFALDGTVVETPSKAPPAQPVVFDSADWKGYAYRVLGTLALPNGTNDEKDLAGLTRYGGIIKAARASDADAVVGALDQYDDATNFRKDKVTVFLGVLVTAGIVTAEEYAAILASWPEA